MIHAVLSYLKYIFNTNKHQTKWDI